MKAKKSLGQNFLKSIPALNKIIEAGEISPEDIVLEIGPGKGVLTAKLLEKAGTVIAVEKDYELYEYLKIKFEKEIALHTLVLVRGDILEFDITELALVNGLVGPRPEPKLIPSNYKIIANIPYNITGAILKKFLTAENQPESMILMVQHEVAKRIVSDKGSLLSISVKAYGEPKMIMKVPARYFSPSPKVDSAIIAIKNISRKVFNSLELEEIFWETVRLGFAHKRKKLSGNLKNHVPIEKLSLLGIKDKRAEDLTLKDWLLLVHQ